MGRVIKITVPSVRKTVTLEVQSHHDMNSVVEALCKQLDLDESKRWNIESHGRRIANSKTMSELGVRYDDVLELVESGDVPCPSCRQWHPKGTNYCTLCGTRVSKKPRKRMSINTKLLSLTLAILLTVSLGLAAPLAIDRFNDATFGSVTILNEPSLLNALKDAQARGALICIHGWRHENFSAISPLEAKVAVEKSIHVFNEAGLVPAAFVSPYLTNNQLPPSVLATIESTGVPTRLPGVENQSRRPEEYGWEWRDMKSLSDPRFAQEHDRIMKERPTYVIVHVEDWNPFLKRLLSDYLQGTNETGIAVRVDDIEVNTPAEKIYDIAQLMGYRSVGLLAYGVIPSGTWRGGDPVIFGTSVNAIMRFYWFFFLASGVFPSSFFVFWRLTSRPSKRGNPEHSSDVKGFLFPPEIPFVSIIVPAYNEERSIARCIERLLIQDFDGKKEIVVVNDGSTDRTAKIASNYPVRLVDLKTNLGKAKALNAGIENAKGNIFIFTDSDSHLSSDAVAAVVRCLERRPDVGAVAGNVLINAADGKKGLLQRFQMIEYRMEQEVNRFLQSVNGNVLVCPGPLFAARRAAIQGIRFSNRSVIEDADLTIEILKKHISVIREPEAIVYTDAPFSLRAWVRQRKRWWYGNLQLWKIHRRWAVRNPWMVLNYLSFITNAFSLLLMLLLPFFLLTYDNIALTFLRSIGYAVTSVALLALLTLPLFIKERRLTAMLVPYGMIYSAMKVVMVTYVYMRYLSRRGIRVAFGPRAITAR